MKYPRALTIAAVIVFSLISAGNISAATFTVLNTNNSGPGSLRQALLDANVNNQADVINFDNAVFNTPQTITLTSGELRIEADGSNPLTVNGPGANLLTIDANNQSRVISLARDCLVTIRGVKVVRGNGMGGPSFQGAGGGILVEGGFPGGDTVNLLTLADSIITDNHTFSGGGGLFFAGPVLVINSTITGNSSVNAGGGIGTSTSIDLKIINSTISGNTSGSSAGGIYVRDGNLRLTNSTVAFNNAVSGAGGIELSVQSPFFGHIYTRNSIIAKNVAANNFGNDLLLGSQGLDSLGNNIVGDATVVFTPPASGDQFNVDPQLDPQLRNNGGIFPTHGLKKNSTAIDGGNNCVLTAGGCVDPNITTDQRGVTRPQDGDGNGTATVDIGAFEASVAEISITPGTPDLRSANDSGSSSADNITTARDLTFDVGGLTNGATVEFYRDGNLIQSAVVAGTSVTFSDNGLPANGTFLYSAKQIVGGATSLHSAGLLVTIDNTAPTVTVNQAATQPDPINTQPVNFSVVFNEIVTGFDSTDVSFAGSTANVSSASAAVTGSGATYNISVGNVTSDGAVVVSVVANSAQDLAGNLSAASTSTDNSVTLDTVHPTVTINQAATQADPVRTTPVNFTVVFSEPVVAFNQADVSLAGSTANVASAIITVTGSGTTYNVAVSNFTSNGGTVQASVLVNAGFDAAGNTSLASTSTDNTVTVDNTSPTVTINQSAGQADPTATLPVNYTVVFSEPVTGFESPDISFTGSTAFTVNAVVNITGSGTTYNVAVSNVNSNGAFIRASIPFGRVMDALGNANINSTSTDNMVTIDNIRPAVTVNQAAGQADPTSVAPINFTVAFSENVTGFTAADVSLAGSTANVSFANINVTGSGTIYNVAVSNITSSGTVQVSILANSVQDALGNLNLASTSTDNTVTFNFKRAPFDFEGDGKTDLSIFRPSVGVWWYLRSTDNADRVYQFGSGTDKLTPGDFTGDGKADIAFWRPATGEWFVLRSEDNAFYAFSFGTSGDIPAPGDFDGDGKADAAVFRPSTATWFILRSSGGVDIHSFGADGDVPTVADYDGDGKADIGIFRPSQGQWWIQRSTAGLLAFQFGNSTDKPVQGDYTGDGKTDIAIWRPATGEWFVLTSETLGVYAFPFGTSGDIPAPGDYDGDGKFDAAVFRPSIGTWFVQRSTAGVFILQFGSTEDKPVPAAFIP